MEEFSRTSRLLGTEKTNSLRNKTVAVFGIGGVGSHCAEALGRAGIGHLIFVDNDVVSLSNCNRQVVALHSTVGKNKTEVMKERILDICPDTKVTTYNTFVLDEEIDEILNAPVDYVIDAIDTVTAKIALAVKTKEKGIPFISSMGTGNKLHGELLQIADLYETSECPLCKVMRKELKKRNIEQLKVVYSKEKPLIPIEETQETKNSTRRAVPGSVSFVPPVAGLLMAGEVVRELLGVE